MRADSPLFQAIKRAEEANRKTVSMKCCLKGCRNNALVGKSAYCKKHHEINNLDMYPLAEVTKTCA